MISSNENNMTNNQLNPPQPIPYPENWLLKKLYRFPILLYRLGLGKLIGKTILILSTYGRESGKVRRAAIEYYMYKGQIYVISGFGDKPDWYKNLKTNPHVSINTDQGIKHAIARKPKTAEEWEGVLIYLKQSPISNISEPEMIRNINDPEILDQIKTWPVLTFDTTEEPCPPAVDADLGWTWPFLLLLLALNILIGWLIHKNKGA